jgi:hypothetical protein
MDKGSEIDGALGGGVGAVVAANDDDDGDLFWRTKALDAHGHVKTMMTKVCFGGQRL